MLFRSILLIVVLCGIFLMNRNEKDVGLFYGLAWGTSYSDVKAELEQESIGKVTTDDRKQIVIVSAENFDNHEGVSAKILYKFDEDGAVCSVFIALDNENSAYSDQELISLYEKEFTDLCGEGEANDDVVLTNWTTPESSIQLTYLSDGFIILEYTDADHEEVEE